MLNTTEFKTIIDVVTRFPTEKACHQYLASRRWSDGVILCPYEECAGETVYVFSDGIRYKCKCCRKIFTAKTGTFMEASKIATIKWFLAIYLILHKKGISSTQLAKDIGITQKSAWFVLQRIREALGQAQPEQLSGVVEIDETFVGGKNKFRHKNKKIQYNPGRGWQDKTPVFGALERADYHIVEREHKVIPGRIVKEKVIDKPSRLVAGVIPDVTTLTIKKAVNAVVEIGSSIMSDGHNSYRGLQLDYTVEAADHGKGQWRVGDCYTNTLEGSWGHFKRSACGMYVRPTKKHMQRYVNEFVFRYNNRDLKTQPQFDTVIKNMNVRLPYKKLIA